MPTAARPSMRATLDRLDSAQKGGEGVPAYTRYVNRWLARFFVALGARIGMTPNQMTGVSALFSLAGIVLVACVRPSPLVGVLAAAALLLGYVLDSADGQLARVTGTGSVTGEWIDHVVDAVRSPMIHTAVLVGWWRGAVDGPSWLLLLPIVFQLLVTGQFFSQILAEQLQRQQVLRGLLAGEPPAAAPSWPAPSRGKSLLRSLVVLPLDSGTLYLLFLLWGFPVAFAAGYTTLLVLFVPFMLISIVPEVPGTLTDGYPLMTVVGYVPGGFDMFHIGHLNVIERARERCDLLVVGVVTDELLISVKGKSPVIPQEERIAIVAALSAVDEVVSDTSPDKRVAWRARHFDVLFKGDDWQGTPKGDALEAEMAEVGVDLRYLPYTANTSSTILRNFLLQATAGAA